MNKTLDVWAIQKHPEELYTALKNIKTDQGDLILFTNLNSIFQLNGQTVGRQFDTELYYIGKDNDAVILLQKDGAASAEDIRNYLEEKGLQYHEVSFKKEMKKIRENGYGGDDEEIEIGLSCVAVPVMKSENKPGFAISVAGPTVRMNEHKKHDIVDDLKKTASSLSEVIYGFAPKKS